MATYVLVHGAGHGGWCYQKVARLLEAEGHTVYSPTLTGLGDRSHLVSPDVDLNMHITEVANLLFYEDLRDVVLVGHSYGGTVIKGAADRVSDRVGKLVFLDAPDGRSQIEAFPLLLEEREKGQVIDGVELVLLPSEDLVRFFGVTDPEDIAWTLPRLTPHPWKTLEQPLVLNNEPTLEAIPQYRIVSTTSLGLGIHDQDLIAKARAEGRFWEIDSGHDLMISEPEAVAGLLAEIASAAVRTTGGV
ncbi:alpha/beta fold hydrolase [Streptomyces luomodiensis]|uniref:Alpha/beta fold hydrolase n=1 Tax=Streptomyces luomodiensis TaxID=3026192 RepID=A0ABY9UPV3_9ACTN|nr:alpha/beta fold hydrolase [Streptomyces sp. SCA4-21]WNE94501.1 alpha/beta fold hydrolase [Streptomyces sp. SCA4-21]